MSNNNTNEIRPMLAMGLAALRNNAKMPQLVNRDYEGMSAQKGAVINVPITDPFTTRAVTPGYTHSATGVNDVTSKVKPINLDQWHESVFIMNDKEYAEVQSSVVPRALDQAIISLADQIDSSLTGLYSTVGNAIGTAGTTPFSAVTDATQARKFLVQNKAQMGNSIHMVLDAEAEAAALGLPNFIENDKRGDSLGITEGYLGRKVGMNWITDQNISTHTNGTLTNGSAFAALINNAAVAVGDETVDMDETSLTGTIVAGDLFTVAGDAQTYTVTTGQTAAANALTAVAFFPAAKKAWADNAVVTFKGTLGGGEYTNNLCFHRDAFVLVSRPLQDISGNANIAWATDPVTGLTLRLEKTRLNKQTQYAFDVLYGVADLRPELAVRVLG